MVGNGSIRQDLAREVVQQHTELADGECARTRAWEPLGDRPEDGARVRGSVEKREHVGNFFRVERRAFDAQLMYRASEVGNARKIDADRRATYRRLRLGCRAKIL